MSLVRSHCATPLSIPLHPLFRLITGSRRWGAHHFPKQGVEIGPLMKWFNKDTNRKWDLYQTWRERKECRLASFEKWGTETDKRWNLSECNFNPVEKIIEKSLKTNYLRFTFLCPVTTLGFLAHLPLEHISYVSIQGSFYPIWECLYARWVPFPKRNGNFLN